MNNPAPPDAAAPASTVKCSVIICAYTMDRWSEMCAAVASAIAQRPLVGEIVVVVDHNDELAKRLADKFPDDIRIFPNEGPQGLSSARNTGVSKSTGEYLVFLDDDAAVEPGAIARMCAHFEDPNVVGVTARVLPAWRGQRPGWFPDEFLWVVGCTHETIQNGRLRNVTGAAMGLRRSVFELVGGFNPELGRSRSKLPMGGEETELCIRVRSAFPPAEFRAEFAATAHHVVTAERLTWQYFVKRCFAEGLSKAQLSSLAAQQEWLSTERGYALRLLTGGLARCGGDLVLRLDPSGLTRAAAIVAGLGAAAVGYTIGRIEERLPRSGPTQPVRQA